MPGMDIRARLTVVGDGPVGAVGRKLDRHFGLPAGNHQHDWAVGMKAVVELPASCDLKPGTVIHTLGFPEPEIFGFMYIHPGNIASQNVAKRLGSTMKGPGKLPPPFQDVVVDVWGQTREQWLARRNGSAA